MLKMHLSFILTSQKKYEILCNIKQSYECILRIVVDVLNRDIIPGIY